MTTPADPADPPRPPPSACPRRRAAATTCRPSLTLKRSAHRKDVSDWVTLQPVRSALGADRAPLPGRVLARATTQAFAPILAANGGGAFVNMLSVASWVGMPTLATYSASKSAAWSFTNSARVELKRQGTQVVGVHVGFVDTDLTAGLDTDKIPPATVAGSVLDALEAGASEAVVDELSRNDQGRATRRPAARLPGYRGAVRGRAVRGAAVA